MARTRIAVQQIQKNTSATVTTAAADSGNGMVFANDGNTELIVNNGGGAPTTVTCKSVPCSHGRSGDVVTIIAAGAKALIGPLDPAGFNQSGGVGGDVNVDITVATTVTVSAVKK